MDATPPISSPYPSQAPNISGPARETTLARRQYGRPSLLLTLLRGAITPVVLLAAACQEGPPPTSLQIEEETASEAALAPAEPRLSLKDSTVAAGENFYHHAVGGWVQRTSPPTGRTSAGPLTDVYDTTKSELITLLTEEVSRDDSRELQQLKTLFRSYTNTETIRARDLSPLSLKMAILESAATKDELFSAMARQDMGFLFPLHIDVRPDIAHTNQFAAYVSQGLLGLPPEAYLSPEHHDTLNQYIDYIKKQFTRLGVDNPEAAAKRIVALEGSLAAVYKSENALQRPELTYNVLTQEDLVRLAPALPWVNILQEQQVEITPHLIVEAPPSLKRLSLAIEAAPLLVWRDYAKLRLLERYAFVLPPPQETMRARPSQHDFFGSPDKSYSRQDMALHMLHAQAPDTLALVFVEHSELATNKHDAEIIIQTLIDLSKERAEGLNWMSLQSRRQARRKLDTLKTKIAYPDKFSIARLPTLAEDDAFGNYLEMEARLLEIGRRQLLRGRAEAVWPTKAYTPTLSYALNRNEVVVPLALIRAPFYDRNNTHAENYGALGVMIAHELWHSLDRRGSEADERGFITQWWTAEDHRHYETHTAPLEKQLEEKGLYRRLHLDELAGDIAGLDLAYAALLETLSAERISDEEQKAQQRAFFYAWCNIMRRVYAEGEAEKRKLTAPHPLAELRVNIAVQNIDAWYTAFDITPDDPMYLSPEERFSPW